MNLQGGKLSECLNLGKITATEDANQDEEVKNTAGGIAAENDGEILRCVNLGNIEGRTAGGLVGINSSIINLCYNRGSVTGTQYVGGIAGKHIDTSTSDNRGIKSSYNTGIVSTATKYGGIIGGIILNGENAISIDQSIIADNAYLDTTSAVGISNVISTGVKERSANYMKSKYFLVDIGDNYKFISGEDYPVLQWQEGETVSGGDFLQIANEIELHEFEEIIRDKGEKYRGKRVDLTANISFASDNWLPIGNLFDQLGSDGTIRFQGNFVGNGRKIIVTKTDGTFKVYSESNNYKD